MPHSTSKQPADYILPLNINGLQGRMLYMPPKNPKKNREILFIYGHHSNLERWWGLIQVLNKYGSVTAPDLPGFGGMQSLYKVGRAPDLDNLADYLATFVKWRYKRRRVTIAGLSFGFLVVTRMLQRYPDLAKKVDLSVSVVGFAHRDDFTFSQRRRAAYLFGSVVFLFPPFAWFFRHIVLSSPILKRVYHKGHNAKEKFKNMEGDIFQETMEREIELWHSNDVRTYMRTTIAMLSVDNCAKRVDVPLWHISVKNDRYFDEHLVEQHLRVVYDDFNHVQSKADSHAPSVIADAKSASKLIPHKLHRYLSKS